MKYYVYENWRVEGHKARVHMASCSSCNDGKGSHPGSGNKNGQWHGPYDDLEIARNNAQRIGKNVRDCKRCLG